MEVLPRNAAQHSPPQSLDLPEKHTLVSNLDINQFKLSQQHRSSYQNKGLIKTWGPQRQKLDTYLTHLCSQIAPCGQVFKPKQAVPVACTSPTWVMMDHLHAAKHIKRLISTSICMILVLSILLDWHTMNTVMLPPFHYSYLKWVILKAQWPTKPNDVLTSISQSALLLVAEVADCRPVVLRKTYCFFLWSSHVRNFSCSAWNKRTTSPCSYTHTQLITISCIIN